MKTKRWEVSSLELELENIGARSEGNDEHNDQAAAEKVIGDADETGSGRSPAKRLGEGVGGSQVVVTENAGTRRQIQSWSLSSHLV